MDADITIIGAGVVGLAIASELTDGRNNIYIIEKNTSHGRGISSRNSEVIHAGIYYPSGSLKAALCVEGRELIYEICRKHNIPHRKSGKLIIAVTDGEKAEIGRLYENAVKNGVSSVSIIDQDRLREMEPNIRAVGGLYSPDTGIVSVHALMDYYLHRSVQSGAEIVLGTEVIGIDRENPGYRVYTKNINGEYFDFTSERIINASG